LMASANTGAKLTKRLVKQLPFVRTGITFAYLGTLIPWMINNHKEGKKFLSGLKNAENITAKVTYLNDYLKADKKAVVADFRAKFKTDMEADAALRKSVREAGMAGLQLFLEKIKMPKLMEKDLNLLLNEMIGDDSDLVEVGEEIELMKAEMRKTAILERVLGKEGLKALQELINDVEHVDQEKVGEIEAHAAKVHRRNLILGICVVTILLISITSLIFAGPLAIPAAAVILDLLVSVAWVGIDGYFFRTSLNDLPAKHEKKALLVSSVLAIGSIALFIVLGGLSMGIVPAVSTLVLGALWLMQNGYVWKRLSANEKRQLENHPTLDSILAAIDKGIDDVSLARKIEKLPTDIRARISTFIDLPTKDAIQMIRKQEMKEMEEMRAEINSLLIKIKEKEHR